MKKEAGQHSLRETILDEMDYTLDSLLVNYNDNTQSPQ